jgi:catechol 2,3-dioxygenase-like lactoylglutathione lyase family enzyme
MQELLHVDGLIPDPDSILPRADEGDQGTNQGIPLVRTPRSKRQGLPYSDTTLEAAMSTTEARSGGATGDASAGKVDMKLEVVTIPVSDVDRAKDFYGSLGWRLDVTPPGVVQYTPPGSGCSVQFGTNRTSAAPGSAQNQFLIVSDIGAARGELEGRGVEVSEVFHIGMEGPVSGPDPDRRSYGSFASFSDPDGNRWLLQEITTRLPGRIDLAATTFGSASDLASAMRRASVAHGEHEKRIGQADPEWPDWYAAYMVAEQAGAELPE